MELKICPNGHHYDASINAVCPECQKQSGSAYSGYSSETIPLGATQATTSGFYTDIGATRPISNYPSETGATMPLDNSTADYGAYNSNKTVAYDQAELGFEPTVGWVICVKGPHKGKDFPLKYGYNSIGRDPQMRICLPNDNQISHMNHGSIIFEPDNRKFYIAVGTATNLLYVNGQFVANTAELVSHDMIKIGATELMFVPLCGESFDWKSVENAY